MIVKRAGEKARWVSPLKSKYGKLRKFKKEIEVTLFFYGQMVDALGPEGDEGRGVAAISFGEVPSNL